MKWKNNFIMQMKQNESAKNPGQKSFTLSQPQKVFAQVFDGQGRLVKTITNEQMLAGAHQLNWNATDEKGSAVSNGIYYLKFNAGNYVETKKISVIK